MPWQSTAAGALQFRRWPEQWLVFHPLSGETHLLSEFAGSVLELLDAECRPVGRDELLSLLFGDAGDISEAEAQALDAALASFQALALAEEVGA